MQKRCNRNDYILLSIDHLYIIAYGYKRIIQFIELLAMLPRRKINAATPVYIPRKKYLCDKAFLCAHIFYNLISVSQSVLTKHETFFFIINELLSFFFYKLTTRQKNLYYTLVKALYVNFLDEYCAVIHW